MAVGMSAAMLIAGLSGCGTLQEITSSSKPLLGDVTDTKASPSASASPSVAAATTAKAVARASGPLDTGTATHVLKQGTFSVQMTYWTSDNAKLYTAGSLKTINVAAHIEDTDSKHRIYLSSFLVTQDDGTTRAQVTKDSGKFEVTPPYPYNTVVTVPAATEGATKLTLTVQLDLLVETAPKSGSYYRSTALDTLTLPLIKDATG
jgi:hypothetical protein